MNFVFYCLIVGQMETMLKQTSTFWRNPHQQISGNVPQYLMPCGCTKEQPLL